MHLIIDHMLLRFITDYRSMLAVISILLAKHPDLLAIEIPEKLHTKLRNEVANSNGKLMQKPHENTVLVYRIGDAPKDKEILERTVVPYRKGQINDQAR